MSHSPVTKYKPVNSSYCGYSLIVFRCPQITLNTLREVQIKKNSGVGPHSILPKPSGRCTFLSLRRDNPVTVLRIRPSSYYFIIQGGLPI